MAYVEHASVATPSDVINRIVNFAEANGWTTLRNQDTSGQRSATVRLAGQSDYVHLYNLDNVSVYLRQSKGYDALLGPADQPNVSPQARATLRAGPYPNVFLFASSSHVWAAFAIAASGEYRHLCFGVLEKAGAYEGGTYIDATNWGESNWWGSFNSNHAPFFPPPSGGVSSVGSVSADVPADGRTNAFHPFGTNYGPPNAKAARSDIGPEETSIGGAMVALADQNAFSGRSILQAITVYVARVGSETYLSPVGTVPDVRFCSINKFEPEQEVPIGSDVYKVFPIAGKRPVNYAGGPQPSASGEFAYAIRKVD